MSGAGGLADGVVAGVQRLLAGRAAVADVGRVRVGRLPSIWRLNWPGSVLGLSSFVHLELARLAGVGDHADDVGVGRDRNGQRAGVVAGGLATVGAGAVVVLADDRLLVVGQVGVRCTAVSPTVWSPVFERLLAGRAAVADVQRAEVRWLPSIWRLNRPGSVLGLEVLLHLELAGLTGVRDHADDVGVGRDRDGQRAGVVAGRLRDRGAGAVVVLADDRLR